VDQSYKTRRPYLRMKADQHWEMAGLARQDNDMKDAERHTQLAREFEQKWRDAEQ
jgi:hypothetical protein